MKRKNIKRPGVVSIVLAVPFAMAILCLGGYLAAYCMFMISRFPAMAKTGQGHDELPSWSVLLASGKYITVDYAVWGIVLLILLVTLKKLQSSLASRIAVVSPRRSVISFGQLIELRSALCKDEEKIRKYEMLLERLESIKRGEKHEDVEGMHGVVPAVFIPVALAAGASVLLRNTGCCLTSPIEFIFDPIEELVVFIAKGVGFIFRQLRKLFGPFMEAALWSFPIRQVGGLDERMLAWPAVYNRLDSDTRSIMRFIGLVAFSIPPVVVLLAVLTSIQFHEVISSRSTLDAADSWSSASILAYLASVALVRVVVVIIGWFVGHPVDSRRGS